MAKQKPSTRSRRSAPATGRGRPGRSRGASRRRDDRPYVILLFGLLVVIGAMALGPLRSLAAANERVDELTQQRDVLAEEVDGLERQKTDLNDPAEQEVYAREQLGLVRPGEIPYVVLPEPDGERGASPDGTADGGEAQDAGARSSPWYRRLVNAVTSLFGE
jgi:cell division protein FtsB